MHRVWSCISFWRDKPSQRLLDWWVWPAQSPRWRELSLRCVSLQMMFHELPSLLSLQISILIQLDQLSCGRSSHRAVRRLIKQFYGDYCVENQTHITIKAFKRYIHSNCISLNRTKFSPPHPFSLLTSGTSLFWNLKCAT